MADNTPFAGLERLLPGEPLDGRFLYTNPTVIDALLKVGALTHRHDGHARLVDPVTAPAVTVANAGGTIPSDSAVFVGYTFLDSDGGETLLSEVTQVSTDPGLTAPTEAPDAVADNTAGTLLAGTYYYALTITDGLGGETDIGPSIDVTIDPGFPNGQITLDNLDTIMADVGGTGWRLWRAVGSGAWHMMVAGTGASVVDDGSFHGDCDVTPPTVPATNQTNKVTVNVAGPAPAGAVSFNLYLSTDGSFEDPSLVANHLVADLGTDIILTTLDTVAGAPPPVSLTLPGAARIDPDTDMVDFPWKRPVANAAALPAVGNTEGDIRETLNDHALHTWDGAAWVTLAGGGGGGAPVYTFDTLIEWQKNGTTVLSLHPRETTVNQVVMEELFDEAAGPIADGYGADGAGLGIPEASANDTNAIHYPAMVPFTSLFDGFVERNFTVGSLNWTRIGVTLGTARTGLFAWVTVAGDLVIATRTVDSEDEADFTVIATEPLPGAPTGGEFWNLQLERVDNHLHATVHSGKVVMADVEADIPAPMQAAFGAGQALSPGLADRWTNPDAWTTDDTRATYYHRYRELWVDVVPEGGGLVSRRLTDGVGDILSNFSTQIVGAYSSADWIDDATTPASYLRNSDHWVQLSGKSVKVSGAAFVRGDVIVTLDEEAWPLTEQLVAVATGDADGEELGMVKIDTAGVVTWLAGRATTPNVKSPFVSFDGISYQAA